MKRIKKALLLLLTLALLLSFCGCYGVSQVVGETVSEALGEALNGNLGETLSEAVGGALNGDLGETLSEAVGEALNSDLGETLSEAVGKALTGLEEAIPGIRSESESEPTDIPESEPIPSETPEPTAALPDEDGYYTSKHDVAEYLIAYRKLPPNFMTKDEARAEYGWEGGGLPDDRCIGGDRFGNYEGLLPDGYSYTECDIDTMGKNSRGAKRIIFTLTADELHIYYTDDHYESFTELYGETK